MSNEVAVWVGFNVFVVAMLVLDLTVFHRKNHEVTIKESLAWTAVWIGLAMVFNIGVYFFAGREHALAFLTGYLIEKSLSVDNIFVFLVIFSYFRVPLSYQHKVLFWGILGALVMRAIFIFSGIALIERFHWLIYVFGAFLVYTGVKMAFHFEHEIHPEKNPILNLIKKIMPVTHDYSDGKFFVYEAGRRMATPLFVALVMIETTDLIFALDSVPAILAVSRDRFIVYTSNIFAILGLRALFFALADVLRRFHLLHYGLSVVLSFVGFKMLLSGYFHIPIEMALGFVVLVLATSIVASLMAGKKPDDKDKGAERDGVTREGVTP